jgi:hypothetical protein
MPLQLPPDPPDRVHQQRLDVHLPKPWGALEPPALGGRRCFAWAMPRA